jgi:hypothetical protein
MANLLRGCVHVPAHRRSRLPTRVIGPDTPTSKLPGPALGSDRRTSGPASAPGHAHRQGRWSRGPAPGTIGPVVDAVKSVVAIENVHAAVDKNSTVVFPAPLMSTIGELGTVLAQETAAAARHQEPAPTTRPVLTGNRSIFGTAAPSAAPAARRS